MAKYFDHNLFINRKTNFNFLNYWWPNYYYNRKTTFKKPHIIIEENSSHLKYQHMKWRVTFRKNFTKVQKIGVRSLRPTV